jgi:type III secretory pathway component EscR
VAVTSFRVIDTLQDLPKEMQLNALAVLYKIFIEEFGLKHNDLLTRADLIISDADKYYHAEIKALRDYIREELKR